MTLADIVETIDQPEGVHHIKTKLFSMLTPEIRHLQQLALESTNHNFSSAEYRATAVNPRHCTTQTLQTCKKRCPSRRTKIFMKIEYFQRGIDAINLPGLLRSKIVTDKAPAYLKNRAPLIISYQYTNTVVSNLSTFSSALLNLDVTNYLLSPRSYQCQMSKYSVSASWAYHNWRFED